MRRITPARILALAGLAGAASLAAVTAPTAQAAQVTCRAPAQGMVFSEPGYVDTGRAGGEPIVFTHPDGTLLYGAHAGTTHYYTPESADPQVTAFGQNYQGQTYYWYSEDGGETWEFADRLTPGSNSPGSGFSDPEFAYDTAGNVYVSEINLVNVSMSKSSDSGRTYQEQNFFAQTITDRQWTEGDEEDVVYIVANAFGGGTFPGQPVGNQGHYLYKSKDGGKTFTNGVADDAGLGDIRVDKRDGTLYETQYSGSELKMRVFPNARADDLTFEDYMISDDVRMIAHWPAFDLDDQGNLYVTWDESGADDVAAGIYYSYSTDRGKTWAAPVRLDADEKTDIWPWLAVGDEGRVGVAWFQADEELPNQNAQTQGTHGWTVMGAQSLNGLGCKDSTVPGFTRSVVVGVPIHTGTICQAGTTCQAALVDRRLGDYFSMEINHEGQFVAAYSDTREGGPVSLPGFTRQIDGPSFFGPADDGGGAVVVPRPAPPVQPKPQPKPADPGSLPATGGSLAGVGAALLAGAALVAYVRRRRAV